MIILGGLPAGITFGPHGITPAQIAVGGPASSPLLNDVDPGDDATELLWRLEPTYLTAGVTEALSMFAWQAAALLWLLALSQPLQILGVAIYPLAGLAGLAAALWPTSVMGIPLTDWKIQLHVVLSLFSAGFLTVAAAQAVTLAVQDRLLH